MFVQGMPQPVQERRTTVKSCIYHRHFRMEVEITYPFIKKRKARLFAMVTQTTIVTPKVSKPKARYVQFELGLKAQPATATSIGTIRSQVSPLSRVRCRAKGTAMAAVSIHTTSHPSGSITFRKQKLGKTRLCMSHPPSCSSAPTPLSKTRPAEAAGPSSIQNDAFGAPASSTLCFCCPAVPCPCKGHSSSSARCGQGVGARPFLFVARARL